MNIENTNQKFSSLLAQGHRRNRQQQQEENLAINNLENIKNRMNENEDLKYSRENEDKKLVFRYNDLTMPAKRKLATILKKDSSLTTVSRMEIETITERLKQANPVIASNWGETFCFGAFPRSTEIKLSRLVYHLGRKYNGTDKEITNISYLIY